MRQWRISEEHKRKVGEGVARAWERRYQQGYMGKGPTAQLNAIKRILKSDDPVWVVQYLEESHRNICFRLQQCTHVHRLGLGGENVANLVCDKLDELLGKSSKDYE